MKALVCELCGGNELIKEDGLYRCMHCNTRYTVEEARSLLIDGPIEVEGIAKSDNLLKREKEARANGDIELAIDYCNRVLDLDINNEDARTELNELNQIITRPNVIFEVHAGKNDDFLITIDGQNAFFGNGNTPHCVVMLEAGTHDINICSTSLTMKLLNGGCYPIEAHAEVEIHNRKQKVAIGIMKELIGWNLEISAPNESVVFGQFRQLDL